MGSPGNNFRDDTATFEVAALLLLYIYVSFKTESKTDCLSVKQQPRYFGGNFKNSCVLSKIIPWTNQKLILVFTERSVQCFGLHFRLSQFSISHTHTERSRRVRYRSVCLPILAAPEGSETECVSSALYFQIQIRSIKIHFFPAYKSNPKKHLK